MITAKTHRRYRPAFTLVEMILAVGIVSVIGLAVTGIVYTSYQNWELSSRRSDVLQNGQAAIEQMVQILRQAKRFIAVTESTDEAGYITFTSVDDITEEFRLNTTTSELEYGQPGALSALAGPVSRLVFTSYDAEGNVLTGAVCVCDIQAVNIEATFVDAEDGSVSTTLSGRVFIPTDKGQGLVGWWKLDETSGLTAADSSDSGNDGTLNNMVGNEWTTGMLGGALDFDGLNDYIDCGNDDNLNITGGITMSAWINMAQRPASNQWYDLKWKANAYSMYLFGKDTKTVLASEIWLDTAYVDIWNGPAIDIPPNSWTHVAITFDCTDIKLYVNAELDYTYNKPGIIGIFADNLLFAKGDGLYFKGLMDDVRIYRCALDLTEIAVLANVLRYRQFAEAKAAFDTTSIIIDTPGGTSQGDLLIAAVATDGDTSSSLAPPDESWTQINIGVYGGNVTLGAWWKNAGVSESASHEFSWLGAEQAYGWIMRFTGHDPSAPINDWAGDGGLSSIPTSPAVTTTIDGCIILRLGAFDDADIIVDSPGLPGHAVITMDSSTTVSTGMVSGGAGYLRQSISGSSGTSMFSLTGSQESRTLSIAISPAP